MKETVVGTPPGTQVSPLLDWGAGILRWFNDLPVWLGPVFEASSFVGSIEVLTVIAAAMLWSVHASLGWRVVLVLLVYGALNTPMKIAFGLPRPYWVLDDITARASESSYGLPSGHAGFAMAVFGRITAGAARAVGPARAWLVGGLVIALVAVSRMYLGVHWPSDVLAGSAAGGVLLWAAVRLEPRVTSFVRDRGLGRNAAAVVAVSAALLGSVALAAVLTSGQVVPEAWTQLAEASLPGGEELAPRALDGPVGSTGALTGFAVGWLVLRRQGGYDAGGSWSRRLARLPIGLTVAALLFGGVGVGPTGGTSLADLALTWVQYAAAGAWMGWGAPSLFVLMGLASRTPAPVPNGPGEHPERPPLPG